MIFFTGFRTRLRLTSYGRPDCNRSRPLALRKLFRSFLSEFWMPYALFCNEARLSNAYPTEADVWKLARKSGLVVETVSEDDRPEPRPILENDYEIKPCRADPQEDPMRNQADAEREAAHGLQWDSLTADV
jgi:hypothetical protein